MYKVIWKENDKEIVRDFDNLGPALDWAKTLKYFVTINGGGYEIVGKFGTDSIKEGVLPDGEQYTWKKRR